VVSLKLAHPVYTVGLPAARRYAGNRHIYSQVYTVL